MKKYFPIAVLCALAVLGLGSCAKDVEEEIVTEQTGVRTVTFSASLADQTKTGLSMKFVPNWINTSLENVHLFETSGSTILEGVDVEMRVPEDRNNEVAYFKADFAEEISIIVNPPSPTGVKTRAADEYTYTGIVAQKVDGKFTIPATQYPDAVSLIDPNADFLIGDTKTSFSESMALKEMDIYFVRPVSVSRLAIMNIEGQKVKTVKITSTDKLTASAAYSDVNFSASTVSWDNSGSNVITISYGEAGKDIPAEATFYAYFISLPGNKNITSVEVTTDQYVYTKSYAGGKTLKFDTVEFRNIAVDMSKVTGVPVGSVTPVDQDIYFFKDNGRVTEDSYDLYPGTTAYVTPELRGAATGATVTYSIACTPAGAATISPAGVVTPVAVGTAVVTATASAVTGYKETEISYTLTITDSTPDAVDQDLSFVKGSETVETDTFDLYPTGGTYTAPTLTGAADGATVTYAIECTPEGVATIDASTGAVTPVKVGTAVITATASAVAPLYKQTSVSYTLTVTDSTPAPVEETTYEYVSGSLTPGTYLIAGSESNELTVALFPNVTTKSWTASSGTVSNGQIINEKVIGTNNTLASFTTDDPDVVNAEVELVQSGSGWLVKAKKTGQYLVAPTADYRVSFTENAASAGVFTAGTAGSDGKRNFTVSSSGRTYYFFHSGSGDGFTMRTTSTTNVRFYQKAKKTQTLSFSAETAQYDLKDGSWDPAMPTLDKTGAVTEVTCTSSDETVATVNANGVVTIASGAKKGDTATITASAPANDEYDAASASYTLSIVDTTPGVMVTYKKVTSTAELVAGGKYIVVYESGSKVFKPFLTTSGTSFSKSTDNVVNVTIASNAITSDALGDCEMTLESGYYLFVDAEGKYIYPVSSGGNTFEAEPTKSHALTITFSNGIASIKNGSYNIYYSTNSSWFSSTSTASSVNTALYKLDDGTTPTPAEQTIAFTPAAAGYDLYTKAWTPSQPVLGGAQTTVTYESSDPTVASVAADGTITALKAGEVTIAAAAAATAEYQAATATCTVTITDSTPVTPGEGKVYKKVTSQSELVADGTYLIVYENGTSSKVFKPIRNGSSFTTSTANAEAVTISNNTITSSELDDHTVVFRNADGNTKFAMWVPAEECYMILRRSNASFVADNTDDGYRATFTVGNGGSVTIVRTDNNTSYYLRYSSSNNYFQVNTTNSTVALYKLDDGTTPTPVAQTIAFTPASAQYDLYTKSWNPSMPVLGGAQTTVSYTSSNDDISPVDFDGSITPLAVGTVTITANAVATLEYQSATATCTVEVVDTTPSTPTGKTYTKISFADGITTGKYLIVNPTDANVFTTVTGNPNAVAVTPASGVISGDYTSYELTITKNGSNYTIQNGDNQYLYYVYTSGDTQTRVAYHSTTENWTVNSLSSDANGFVFKWTSDSQYIYWSNTFFKIGSQQTGVHLYKLNDGGTTPDDPEPPTPSTQYYTKVNSRDDLPGTSQTSATGDYLFVYENGTKAYVFKAICDGTPTGAGNQGNNHVELTKSGSAIEVDLTADGIAATDVVKDCKIQLAHHTTATRNDWNIKPDRLGSYWVRVNNSSTDGLRILAMTSAGYSGTFTFSGTGNNLEIKRTDSNRDAYWSYNSTNNCFEATSTASKISIYKLSE